MPTREMEKIISTINSKEALYDLMYQMYLLYNIRRGEEDVKAGRTFPISELKERLAKERLSNV